MLQCKLIAVGHVLYENVQECHHVCLTEIQIDSYPDLYLSEVDVLAVPNSLSYITCPADAQDYPLTSGRSQLHHSGHKCNQTMSTPSD